MLYCHCMCVNASVRVGVACSMSVHCMFNHSWYIITGIFTQNNQQFNYNRVNFGWWLIFKVWEPCLVIVGNFMTLKLPCFIRRITTVQVWAALLQPLQEATCWVLKGQMVPQWQCYQAVHTQSLNDTLEINFFHLARVESIERIKLLSSSRLSPLSPGTLPRVSAALWLIRLLWHSLCQGPFQSFMQ